MLKYIKSNWREALSLAVFVSLLLFGLLALGSSEVAESSGASAAVSLVVTLLGGATKFACVLALAWLGLYTIPEVAPFMFSGSFDQWWERRSETERGWIGLGSAAVLAIVAALCMASS